MLLTCFLFSQINFSDTYSSVQDDISPGANLLTSVEILVSGVCFLKVLVQNYYFRSNIQLCFHLTSVVCFDGSPNLVNISDLGLSCLLLFKWVRFVV